MISLSGGYRVRWFRESDLDTYIQGLNENLYECYDEARFNWKMVETPFSLGFVSIAVVESPAGEPVAFNSFMPLRVRTKEGSFPMVQGCDGFVHPAHRRMGLFQMTLRFMVQELSGRGPEFLMGFNFGGSAGAAQKIGSTVTCDAQVWEGGAEDVLSPVVPGEEDVSVRRIGLTELHSLYEYWASNMDLLHYHRTPEYLRWRYSHPLRKSSFYRVSFLDEMGYVTVSLEGNSDGSSDVFFEDYTPSMVKPAVLAAVLREVARGGKELATVHATGLNCSALPSAASALGLVPDSTYTLIMKAINGVETRGERLFRGNTELTRVEGWHVASSDVF